MSCDPFCACGCCEGVAPATPEPVANRPGLSRLSRRVGRWATFLETLQARLASRDFPELAGLTTRAPDDFSLGLLDGFATLADVLTFYQERLANEGYLGTATERRSIFELARLVGYRPRPGVAASVHLAFELEQGHRLEIPAGTRAQSQPGPGELPQAFETVEPVEARTEWNRMPMRLTRPQRIERVRFDTGGTLFLQGIQTQLKANDPLLIEYDGATRDVELYRVTAVLPDAVKDRTRVEITPWIPVVTAIDEKALAEAVVAVARHYADPARVVSPGTKMSKRVVAHLESLIALEHEPFELLEQLKETVFPDLSASFEAAVAGNFTLLAPWIEEVQERLAGAQFQTAPAAQAVAAGELEDVIEDLARPRSVPPANRLRLDRNLADTLSTRSDARKRVFVATRPEVADTLYLAWANLPVTARPIAKVYALRAKAAPFAHNSPFKVTSQTDFQTVPATVTTASEEWSLADTSPATTQPFGPRTLSLDATYPQILPDSWIAVHRPDSSEEIDALVIARVTTVQDRALAAFGLTGKVTRLGLDQDWLVFDPDNEAFDDFDIIRGSQVFGAPEELALAEEEIDPVAQAVCGGELELGGVFDGLEAGRWVIVAGERTDVVVTSQPGGLIAIDEEGTTASQPATVKERVAGVPGRELVMIAGVEQAFDAGLPGDRVVTRLKLAEDLAYCYRRDTVVVYGNVARATHGETKAEILGGGDARVPLQRFVLKQKPLTFTSAATVTGTESSLVVRVADVAWKEVPNLAGTGPAERIYSTVIDDEGNVTVTFGDGAHGARLPTAPDNLRATYRVGIGRPGNVKAEQISLLVSRPLGAKGVLNPLPAQGGADPESRDQARRNTPLALLALDRLVSLSDYAAFARTFAGIAKASVAALPWQGRTVVHLTVAGEDDIALDAGSELLANLDEALARYGDPLVPVLIAPRIAARLVLSAKVRLLPEYLWEKVEPRLRAALAARFGFEQRGLGQDLYASEVLATLQSVKGVDWIDLDALDYTTGELAEAGWQGLLERLAGEPPARIPVPLAQVSRQGTRERILPAGLLYLDPNLPDLVVLKELVP
ncbi:MAG TPA: putative baseplate assembly protein [Thermoanaerobaculia bacterium]|nr:putative baseplate assembly protein [Thermoanaerobaculia bacterium]